MKTCIIYYSPCGTTAALANAVAAGLGFEDAIGLDLAAPENRRIPYEPGAYEVTVFAFPVYHKALPELCLPYLKSIEGGGNSPAVLLVNGGGEGFGTVLQQLNKLVSERGFTVIAGGEFVSNHSFAPGLSAGRPSEADIDEAVNLGRGALQKLSGPIEPVEIGSADLSPALFWPSYEIKVSDACTGCGLCARSCVCGAINPTDPTETDSLRCTMCMRCINICTERARSIEDPEYKARARYLELTEAKDRKIKIVL